MKKSKVQNPSSKEIPNAKIQACAPDHLVLAAWNLFGFWSLEFGILRARITSLCTLLAFCALASCRPDMANQPRAKPLSESEFFADGTNARPLPAHVVARGDVREDEAFSTGLTTGAHVTQLPVAVTSALLDRGREQHEIFCATCHGQTGVGNGPVVQHGFPRPAPYQLDRLRNAPAGYLFEVISNGHGTMAGYAAQIAPADRWAITAYIRGLQTTANPQSPPPP